MAVKKPITLYSGILKQIQSGDVTTGESSATIAKSYGTRAESVAKKAESQGSLDNSIADRAQSLARLGGSESYGKRGESLAKRAESQGSLDNSIADLGVSRASEATSIGIRAGSVATIDKSVAIRGESVAKKAESQGSLDNSIADRGQSLGRRAGSVATIDKSVAIRGESVAKKAESQGSLDNSLADRGLSIARLGGGTGFNVVEKLAWEMKLDSTDLGSDNGTMFGIMGCINFAPLVLGTTWVAFKVPNSFPETSDIKMKLVYSCSGADLAKTVIVLTSWWCIAAADVPASGTPAGTASDTITTSSDNVGKVQTLELTNGKVGNASITASTVLIVVKITRSGTTDTYTGTFQLQSIQFYN